MAGSPVILSMNAGQDTFDAETRKRALIVYTGASLPDHTGEARRLGRRAKGQQSSTQSVSPARGAEKTARRC
jgi:hypothetical protein